ncbi:MAG TPA: hypothetical protein VK929_07765 [Longimicrobiales bacterium]|nr:hypothetical protein [Longimicrobiales bacterium]
MKTLDTWRVPVVLAATVLLGACTNPASPGQHLRAYGVLVLEDGEPLVRAMGTDVDGSLEVTAGASRGPLVVRMLDRDGDEMGPAQGYYLAVNEANASVARWDQAVAGEYGGTLVGVGAGQTQFEFCKMHGAIGGGHADGCQTVTVTVHAGT